MQKQRFYIGEVAEALDRVPHSLRIWQYKGILPEELIPYRDERGWRYWTQEQIKGLKTWMEVEDMRPGKGLSTVNKD